MPTSSAPEAIARRISDDAAQWCIRLTEADCSEHERQQCAHWLASDPAHRREFDAMREIWAISQALPLSDAAPAPAASVTPPAPARVRRYRRPLQAVAALALVLPLSGLIGWALNLVPSSYQRFDSQGAVRKVTLADGSQVELNLNSQVSFARYKDRRSATLAKGEAYFEVRHDSHQPFLVNAGQGQVRVTGTHFNVWTDRNAVRVTLTQGAVQVMSDRAHPELQVTLSPGMQAQYGRGQAIPRTSEAALATALAWREGKLILADLTLDDALPQINRYLTSPLHVSDDSVGQLRIGGIYDTHNMAALVDDLPKVLPVYLSRNEQGEQVIRSKRPYPP